MKKQSRMKQRIAILLIVVMVVTSSFGTAFAAGGGYTTFTEYVTYCESEFANQTVQLHQAKDAALALYTFDENGYTSAGFSREAYENVATMIIDDLKAALDKEKAACFDNANAVQASGGSIADLSVESITAVTNVDVDGMGHTYLTAEGMQAAIEGRETANGALTSEQISLEKQKYTGMIRQTNSDNYFESEAVQRLENTKVNEIWGISDSSLNNVISQCQAIYSAFLTELSNYEMVEGNAQDLGWSNLGNNLKYAMNYETGDLYIKGTGYLNSLPYQNDDYYRQQVRTINIGPNVQIGAGRFEYLCGIYPNLMAINIDENHAQYSSVDGVVFSKNKDVLYRYPAKKVGDTYTVPGSVITLYQRAFGSCQNLEQIELSPNLMDIGESWTFQSCTKLESIVIPENVTSIGRYIFYGCTSLQKVSLLGNVTEIGHMAFYDCAQLKEIVLPESLQEVGDSAFSGCENLQTITIPINVQRIGTWAFNNCQALTTVDFGQNLQLQEIGDYTFQRCENLQSIIIPDSVQRIGMCAFERCSALNSVDFGENSQLQEISINSFYGCSNLQTITIPVGVQKIGEWAFGDCQALTNVDFGRNLQLQEIGANTFYRCYNLQSIIIPAGVQRIGDSAFSNCRKLSDVTIQEGIEEIGESAFNNTGIKNLRLPSTLQSMGWAAFAYCYSLQEVNFANGCKLTSIPSSAFASCWRLRSITIPNGVESIGSSAFRDCSNLYSVKLPNSLQSIGSNAFSNSGVGSITIPSSLKSLGSYAFSNCYNLTTVKQLDQSAITSIPEFAFGDCDWLTDITLPSTIENIGNYAFYNCHRLGEISIGAAVKEIGYRAFMYCYNLQKVTFEIGSQLTKISSMTFYDCSSLQGIVIPEKVTSIGDSAFENCQNLQSVVFPDGLKSISPWAFSSSGLTSAVIPASVDTIGNYAFCQSWELSNLELAEGLEQIGHAAFRWTGVEEVTIPATVKIIKSDAFGSSNLKTVAFAEESQVTVIRNGTFRDCENLTSITLPKGLERIEACAFYRCSSLTDITLPESLYEIGRSAFAHTSALNRINLPKGITEICDTTFLRSGISEVRGFENVREVGYAAFQGCENLQSLNVTSNLNWLGNYAFMETGLTEMNFPAGTGNWDQLRKVPTGLFKNCKNLTSVSIPEGISSIRNQAFEGCVSLKTFDFPDSLTYLGSRAFYGSGLTAAVLPDGVNVYGGNLYGDFSWIHPETFAKSDIEAISMSGNVRSIGYSAFEDCVNLKQIDLRDVTVSFFPNSGADPREKGFLSVGSSAFRNCLKLTTTGLLETGGEKIDGTGGIHSSAYENCKSLTGTLNLAGYLLGRYAFAGCTGITEINFAPVENTTDGQLQEPYVLPYGVFQNCSSVESVTLPENLSTIEGRAFEGCKALKTIELPASLTELAARAFYGSGLENIVLPETITYIKPETFAASGLTTVTLPETVRGIGYSAFEGCENLTDIDLSKVPYIEDKAFLGCNSLKEVTIGDAVWSNTLQKYPYLGQQSLAIPYLKVIFEGALPEMNNPFDSTAKVMVHCEKCGDVTALKTYDIFYTHNFDGGTCTHCGASLGSIETMGTDGKLVKYPIDKAKGQYIVFNKETGEVIGISYFNNAITDLTLPETIDGVAVIGLGDGAFKNNPDLSGVILNDGIQTIGSQVFANTAVDSLILPSSVTKVAGDAFNDSNLKKLTLPLSASFTDGFKLPTLTDFTFTEGTEEAYDYDSGDYKLTPWYKNRAKGISITFNEGISRIGDYTFANQKMTSYDLPASLKEIGDNAFYRNGQLTSVDMKEGVERIGYEAFAECELLETITLPTTLVNMKYNSFAGDDELVAVVYKDTYAKKAAAKYGITYKVDKDGPEVAPPEKPDESGIGQVQVDNCYGKIGGTQTVIVPIEMPVNPGIISMKLQLDFDRDALELVAVENGEIFADGSLILDVENIGTTSALVWSNSEMDTNITKTGILAKLVFKVKDTANIGSYPITLVCDFNDAGAVNVNNNSIRFEVESGSIYAQNFLYGDVTADERINNNDAAYLQRNVANWSAYMEINQDAADLDLNSYINLQDVIILERHLAGWKDYKKIPKEAN